MMRHVRLGFMTFLMGLLSYIGCGEDHSKDQFLPHQVSSWRVTPGGHDRDGGPFSSVLGGWVTESEIDSGVDAGFEDFARTFPQFTLTVNHVALNDDYVMYVPGAGWAGGVEYYGGSAVHVCLWSRGTSTLDPGAEFIKRPPGDDGFGVSYQYWRFTGLPLCPAIKHELLHSVIGDPNHTSPLWAYAN